MGLWEYSDMVSRLWDDEARRRWSNRNVSPVMSWGVVIGFVGAFVALVLLFRCDSASKERKEQNEKAELVEAETLAKQLGTKLAAIETLAVIPDAACPPSVKRISVIHQRSFVHSILEKGPPPAVPPVQSTPFVWIAQGELLFDAQRTKQVARLRELVADPYLAVVVPTKEAPIEFGTGHFEGQIQVLDTATVKPVCAMTLIFDVPQPPTTKDDAQAWSEAFWKAADPALSKAAPNARFRLD